MRTRRVLTLTALALVARITASDAQIQPLDGLEIPLGGGFNVLSGATSLPCVKFESSAPVREGQNTEFSFRALKSIRELRTVTEMSASMSIGYGPFTSKGTAESATARLLNAYSTSVLLRVRVTNPPHVMSQAVLTEEALGLLADPAAFALRCGTHFASQRVTGGDFVAVLSISSSSDAEKNRTDAELSAHYGTFGSGDARFRTASEIITGKSGVAYEVHRRGSNDPVPPAVPAALTAYALNYPTRVAPGSSGERGLYVILSEYSTLDPRARSFAPQVHFLDQVADAIATLQDHINTLRFARTKPEQFPGLIPTELDAHINRLEARRNTVRNVGIQCILDPVHACLTHEFTLDALQIPARPVWRRVDVNTPNPQHCTPVSEQTRWVVAARGFYSPWRPGRGPNNPWRQTLAVVYIDQRNIRSEMGRTLGNAPFLVQPSAPGSICVRITDGGSTSDNHHKRGEPLDVAIYALPSDS